MFFSTQDALAYRAIGDALRKKEEEHEYTEEERLYQSAQQEMSSVLIQLLVKELDDGYFYKSVQTACMMRDYAVVPVKRDVPAERAVSDLLDACEKARNFLRDVSRGVSVDLKPLEYELNQLLYEYGSKVAP